MKFSLLILLFVLLSCNNRQFVKPDITDINGVIKAVSYSDTFNSKYCVYNRLFDNHLSIKSRDYRDTLVPQIPMAIDYIDLLNNISLITDCRKNDSLFVAYQVDSMTSIPLDSNIFNSIKTSNSRHDYNCYEFYLPIFLVNSLDSTRTGMFWFWKVGSPSTTALYIYQSEPTKGCSRSGKQRLWLCFCERN